MVPDKDDIIECSIGVIASPDAAFLKMNVSVTILNERKGRINFQVQIEQLSACRKTANDITKQERAWKMLNTKVNVTCDRNTIVVVTLKIAKKSH